MAEQSNAGFAKLGKRTEVREVGVVVHGREVGAVASVNGNGWYSFNTNVTERVKDESEDGARAVAHFGKRAHGFDGAVPGRLLVRRTVEITIGGKVVGNMKAGSGTDADGRTVPAGWKVHVPGFELPDPSGGKPSGLHRFESEDAALRAVEAWWTGGAR